MATDSNPLHVLHVLGVTQDEGGVLSVVRGIQSALPAPEYKHTVLVNDSYVDVRKPALNVVRARHLIAEAPSKTLLRASIKSYGELRNIVADLKPSVVHAHNRGAFLPSLLLAKVADVPVLITHHMYASHTRMYQHATRLRNVRTVLLTQNMFKHYGLALDPGRIDMVSECYDEALLAEPLVERRDFSNELRIVGVGSIVRWKNWGLLLEALKLLPDRLRERVKFEHWGPVTPDADSQSFAQELYMKTEQQRLTAQVQWNGATTAVREKLRAADIFLIPSNNEPCSVAIMEALAVGLPVIASRSGGNVDLIRDGETGLLFTMNNARSLADALEKTLEGKTNFATPSKIRDSVRHRRASAVGADYAKIYREMAGSTREAVSRLRRG